MSILFQNESAQDFKQLLSVEPYMQSLVSPEKFLFRGFTVAEGGLTQSWKNVLVFISK